MSWFVRMTYLNGETRDFYCTSRAEARNFARAHHLWSGSMTIRRTTDPDHVVEGH